ncbi:manganese/zinc-transporting P-type ATPase C [Candidatus Magnetomoraceae bacterium gMMP-13]
MKKSLKKNFVICQSIPGRLRIKVKAIRFAKVRASKLETWLSQQEGIKDIQARFKSGSVIFIYDSDKISPDVLLEFVAQGLGFNPSQPKNRCVCGMECEVCRPVKKLKPKSSLFRKLMGVIALTGFVVYTVIKQVIFKSSVAQGPFSLVAIVSLVSSIPLFDHAIEDIRQGKTLSLFPFLASTTVLGTIMGEALTALEVIWILRVGMLLEEYVSEQSRRAISEILQVAAKDTYIFIDGIEVQVPVEKVRSGDTVVIHTGEKIPVDGVVTKGEALIDEAHITGRAEPEVRGEKDQVFAGTIVQHGIIFIKAEKVGDDTYLCRILHLVEDSLANRSSSEKQADILATRLFKLGSAATLGTLFLTADPFRAFTVMLVMACPCATVLAASTAVTAALANAARNHVLIKGGLYLEMVGKADSFCFDKTGTITTDAPEIVNILPASPYLTKNHVVRLAAMAEIHNEHPMAKAVIKEAEIRGIKPQPHATCEFIIGRGVKASMNDTQILVGNRKLMHEADIDISYFTDKSKDLIASGHTLLYVVKNKTLEGLISVKNIMRPKTKTIIDWLRKDGIKDLYLVTGDNEPVARALAESLNFDDYHANLLPEDKAFYINELETQGKKVVMIGDGVNDALALSKASVGIAMGAGGAEVAIEAADIALVDSDLERIVALRQLSQQTINVIEQNYYLATSTNVFGTVFGAAGLLTPLMGGMLHIVHTLGILVNSSRLLKWKPKALEATGN